jgi:transposase InsO family protein
LNVDNGKGHGWLTRHLTFDQLRYHTDDGSQYVSIAYTDRLEELGVTASISTVGDSFDNDMTESMFALFKTKLFRNPAVLSRIGGHWKGLDDLELETTKWVSWFYEDRIHGELEDLTPAVVEANYADKYQATAA